MTPRLELVFSMRWMMFPGGRRPPFDAELVWLLAMILLALALLIGRWFGGC